MQTLVKIGPSNVRVAEKKERNGTNPKFYTRLDLNPGPQLVAPVLYRLSYGVSRQNPNIYIYVVCVCYCICECMYI